MLDNTLGLPDMMVAAQLIRVIVTESCRSKLISNSSGIHSIAFAPSSFLRSTVSVLSSNHSSCLTRSRTWGYPSNTCSIQGTHIVNMFRPGQKAATAAGELLGMPSDRLSTINIQHQRPDLQVRAYLLGKKASARIGYNALVRLN